MTFPFLWWRIKFKNQHFMKLKSPHSIFGHGCIIPTYRSGLELFDNIYTLSSIVVLSLYGYTEILEVWQDKINLTKRV